MLNAPVFADGLDDIAQEFLVESYESLDRLDGDVYEYACHEANYGMEGILSGARAEEKASGSVRQAK